jgi:hypothetical protein
MSQTYSLLIPVLMCMLFAGFFIVVVGGIIFLVNRSAKTVNRTWGDLAARTGLTLKPAALFSSPELSGEYRQRALRVYTYSVGTAKNRTTYSAVSLAVKNPSNSTLEITPSGTVGSFLGKLVNAQDVEIGEAEFDQRFVIKSNPPDFASKVLSESGVLVGIKEIPGAFRIEVEGPSLTYSKRGVEENTEFLEKMFDTLSALADRVEAQA